MTSKRQGLLDAIAAQISDYQQGVGEPRTPKQIDDWAKQFDKSVQEPILAEMVHVLERQYISKQAFEAGLRAMVRASKLVKPTPKEFWQRANFLWIQKKGSSQAVMRKLFTAALKAETGLDIDKCGSPDGPHFYLDDGVFTATHVRWDLIDWVKTKAPKKAVVNVLALAIHDGRTAYTSAEVAKLAKSLGKDIKIEGWWRMVGIPEQEGQGEETGVLNRRTGNLVGGHQRFKILLARGVKEVDVSVVDLPLEREKALNIALNKISGDWDERKLGALLDELTATPDLDVLLTGFDMGEIDGLIATSRLDLDPARDESFDIEEAMRLAGKGPAITKPGDLITLGRDPRLQHRLVCGDSTDHAQVRRLMNGERAILFCTDPPYLIGYDGTNHPGKGKANKDWSDTYGVTWDDAVEDTALYEGFIGAAVAEAIAPNAAWYCWHASRRQAMLESMWVKHGAFVHAQIVWAKNRGVLTRTWYAWQHEPCLFGWIVGKKPPRRSNTYLSTVWQIPTIPNGDERPEHPHRRRRHRERDARSEPRPARAACAVVQRHASEGGQCDDERARGRHNPAPRLAPRDADRHGPQPRVAEPDLSRRRADGGRREALGPMAIDLHGAFGERANGTRRGRAVLQLEPGGNACGREGPVAGARELRAVDGHAADGGAGELRRREAEPPGRPRARHVQGARLCLLG